MKDPPKRNNLTNFHASLNSANTTEISTTLPQK